MSECSFSLTPHNEEYVTLNVTAKLFHVLLNSFCTIVEVWIISSIQILSTISLCLR